MTIGKETLDRYAHVIADKHDLSGVVVLAVYPSEDSSNEVHFETTVLTDDLNLLVDMANYLEGFVGRLRDDAARAEAAGKKPS